MSCNNRHSTIFSRFSTFVLAGLLCFAGSASADISLNAARVGAKDVPKIAEFYKTAFGLQEVQRIPMRDSFEIMLNFGSTVEEAKANSNAQVVLIPTEHVSADDEVAHIIFTVTDIHSVANAIKAAGGEIEREPFEFGKSGIMICMAKDPAGNHIELLQYH